MNGPFSSRRKWELTSEAFGQLLAWLDADSERAGQRYEKIRSRLIDIFVCRGCLVSEELADETITRVARKVPKIAGTYVGQPELYFYGVAQMVYREYGRRRSETVPVPRSNPPPDERIHACLDQCLQTLTSDNRELILQYYVEEAGAKIEHRKELARRLDVDLNTLRIRTYRIRECLAVCIDECLRQKNAE